MNLHLKNKTALITGASKGLGHAIALQLAAEGMNLILLARSKNLLTDLASQIEPARSLIYPADLTDPAVPDAAIAAALKHFGCLDLLINNAGATQRGDFLTLPDQAWSDGYNLKFFGAMRLSRAAWPHLIATQGSIINIVGVGGRTGSAEFTIGGSVNAALLNLTKSLADRGTKDGIRVNAINPGSILTDRLTQRIARHAQEHNLTPETAAAHMTQSLAIARFGEPAEIAAMVAFLASPHAAYIQGALIDIDGGLTRTM